MEAAVVAFSTMSNHPLVDRLLPATMLPHLGPTQRPDSWSASAIDSELGTLFKNESLSAERQQLIRALVLLWHDHLEAAHEIAQGVDNPNGAFVHGIMHRREPDYGNAAYWFRRVGKHPAFPAIARKVTELAQGKKATKLALNLLENGAWNPFAFIDACASVAANSGAEHDRQFLQEVQRIEFETLLERFVGAA